MMFFFFFQAEDGIRDLYVTGVQTCALPIWRFWLLSAAIAPPAVPSFMTTIPSSRLLVLVRHCSTSACALAGSQPGVYVSHATLSLPASIRGLRNLSWPSLYFVVP